MGTKILKIKRRATSKAESTCRQREGGGTEVKPDQAKARRRRERGRERVWARGKIELAG